MELELGPVKLDELFNDLQDFTSTQAGEELELADSHADTSDEIIARQLPAAATSDAQSG